MTEGAKKCFLVVRHWRGKERVLKIADSLEDAKTFYRAESAKLRDGDVVLFEAALAKLEGTSGGYNRTRW